MDRILEQGYTPLVALRYLSIGANSNDHKIKWITATTALEIAIKEIFIRIDPKLEDLLTEIPSPPLYKMYKGILKSITGYESPYYKEIQKGVQIRNRIIHRPINIYIAAQDSFNYIYIWQIVQLITCCL